MAETDQMFDVVVEPEGGNPGTAGVGVRYRPGDRPDKSVTVEQLWPNGDADPVYIPEEDLGELIFELMDIYLEVADDE